MEITDRNYRSAIYPKDVANITGKSVKSASRLVAKIKKELGKDRHHILTINEFCQYMGFKIKDIMGSMNL